MQGIDLGGMDKETHAAAYGFFDGLHGRPSDLEQLLPGEADAYLHAYSKGMTERVRMHRATVPQAAGGELVIVRQPEVYPNGRYEMGPDRTWGVVFP